MFLIAGYARYNGPYVWVRSVAHSLGLSVLGQDGNVPKLARACPRQLWDMSVLDGSGTCPTTL